ncbi:MAG: SMP-30/gluconolactonase/LRE family protein [Thermoflexales bacterium]|nr:SMP-30/gluconolactonase/LRE family protein [Thermoflexales bacterium]
MIRKFSFFALLILALALTGGGSAGAQGYQRPDERAISPSSGGDEIGPPVAVAPAVSLGQPGLSFRYVRTFGVTEEPYPADTDHLNGPTGLFIDASNRLYVTEKDGHRLLRFTASGASDLTIGHAGLPGYGDDDLTSPLDVAVDASGNIWTVFSPAVKKFDASGNPLLTIPPTNPWEGGDDEYHFNGPMGVAFDASGRLFVADRWNHRIQVYDVSGGAPAYVLTIGVTGEPRSDNTGFNEPTRIAFDGSGRLYVVDANNHRVQRCTQSAGPPETWACAAFFGVTGVPGNDLSHLEYPWGIAVRDANVFIADGANNRVLQCDLTGTCVLFAGVTDEPGTDNAHFLWPEDVAVDSSGNVYVSDPVAHRVQKFNSSGTYIGTVGVTLVPYMPDDARLNKPWGVAVSPDGSIYVTENRGFRLVKMNAAGVQQWTVGQAGVYGNDNAHFGDWWAGIEGSSAVDAAGRVYVPDTANHRIQIFNPNGTYSATLGSGPGTGNYEFSAPTGVAISPVNGDIFVSDQGNHRMMVYGSNWVYKTQIGVAGESGNDNNHFNLPYGVAVDAGGNLYVADTENHRVQKCAPSGATYTCSTFAGETGVFSDDFGHLHPLAVAVDREGRVYVADVWNSRVQVFDPTGAYLTTVGGSLDNTSGGLHSPTGVAVDSAGNLYVADSDNHRIQKFSPGYPGWQQANINGFGERHINHASALEVFGGQMYAGTWSDEGTLAGVWRTSDGEAWNPFYPGWSDSTAVYDAQVFGSFLYVGTYTNDGGEIWRTNGITWTRVVSGGFGDANNLIVNALAVHANALYAATTNWATGIEIWRSTSGNAGSWTQVNTDNFGGTPVAASEVVMEVYTGSLYVGLGRAGKAELWRTGDGVTWTSVFTNGLGDAGNSHVAAMAEFKGAFYIGLRNVVTGGQLWRSTDGLNWTNVFTGGLGNPQNGRLYGLIPFDGHLFAVFSNPATGTEVWRTADGTHWQPVARDGWGDRNNIIADYFDKGATVFNNRLYIGAGNQANGGEVWRFAYQKVFLPLVLRNR